MQLSILVLNLVYAALGVVGGLVKPQRHCVRGTACERGIGDLGGEVDLRPVR